LKEKDPKCYQMIGMKIAELMKQATNLNPYRDQLKKSKLLINWIDTAKAWLDVEQKELNVEQKELQLKLEQKELDVKQKDLVVEQKKLDVVQIDLD
jgi:hypothetical protein